MKLFLAIPLAFLAVIPVIAQSGPSYDYGPPTVALVSPTGSGPYGALTTTGTSGQSYDYAPSVLILGYNATTKKYYVCGTANPCTGSGSGGSGSGPTVSTNGTNNTSQTALNFVNSGPYVFTNPTGGNEQIGTASGYYFPTTTDQSNWNAQVPNPANNSSATFKQSNTGTDTGVPTPTAGQDILAYTGGSLQRSANGAAYALLGTVTSVALSMPGVIFNSVVPGSPVTSTGTLAPTLANQAANTVFGNFTGSSATPTFSAAPVFSAANLTNFPTFNQNTTGTSSNVTGVVSIPNGGTGATTAAAALTNLGAQPAIGNLAAYTVYGNPTNAAAAPVGTTNPVTTTLSTNAASGNWYQGSAPGGTANCTQGTVTGCTAFITQTAAKTYAIGSTQGGNDGTIDALATQATKLATARAIAGVPFDGTAAIAIPSTGLSDSANLARITTANAFGANQQSGSNYAITGGSVNGTTIGATTPSTGAFTYATSNLETVTFSATPTFSATTGRSRIVLTANVTSSTLAAGVDGQRKCFDIAQNATGGFTFVFPTTVHGAGTIGTTASKDNTQCFTYYTASTAWLADGAMVTNE